MHWGLGNSLLDILAQNDTEIKEDEDTLSKATFYEVYNTNK